LNKWWFWVIVCLSLVWIIDSIAVGLNEEPCECAVSEESFIAVCELYNGQAELSDSCGELAEMYAEELDLSFTWTDQEQLNCYSLIG